LSDFNLTEWIKYKDILLEEDLEAVRKLSLIVRLAEALDKTHRGVVQDISCDILGDSVIMKTIVTIDASIEIREALKSSQDFKKVYKKTLEVL
jgi:exopolyphosphatase/guanosine-5'-triphosphate,3'-diphosphate pyrophosphatase